MRIFHGPSNVGGTAATLASAQRELGYDAVSYCYPSPVYGFQGDRTWSRGMLDVLGPAVAARRLGVARFDVYQFYAGQTFTGDIMADLNWLKSRGKRLFMYFCGCDIRDSKVAIEKYRYSACKECWPMTCSVNRSEAIEASVTLADGVYVSTPDLLEFVPGALLIPQPVNLAEIASTQTVGGAPSKSGPIRVVHAPTDRQKKGTDHIIHAIDRLRADGVSVELELVQQRRREDVLDAVASAHVVVDQVLIGSYGRLSVEAMALGRPVICYIRDDLRAAYPEDPPIVSANRDTLYEVLASFVQNEDGWASLGERGRAYARRWHASHVVAQRMIDLYESPAR